jgi:hypothetical protein
MPNNGMTNNGMPNNGAPYTPYSPPQSSNYLPLIFITIGVTAVVTLGALFCISKISGNKKNHTLKDDSVNIVKNYDVLTEASTEEITEEETEPPTEAPAPTEPSNYTEYINRLVDGAYSIGWLNATNSHDASCMLPYTSPEYPVYQMLGTDYWQERPSVRFDYIQNVKVYGINKKYDGCYIVYVSYDYELYNSSTGQYSSNTELTVDTVVWDGSEYKLSEHNWKNDLPLGSTVTMSSFG